MTRTAMRASRWSIRAFPGGLGRWAAVHERVSGFGGADALQEGPSDIGKPPQSLEVKYGSLRCFTLIGI
jgi:hypothetical protein